MPHSFSNENEETFTVSSGNIFEDLALENSPELLIKADLMHAIATEIARQGLTQQQAAYLVGENQPNISRIVNGKMEDFSQERLIDILRRLSIDVEIRIHHRKAFTHFFGGLIRKGQGEE